MQLPSRQSPQSLFDDLSGLFPRFSSGPLNVEGTALLLEKVINQAPDHDIWCAVYDLVTPTTPPITPRVTISSVPDTPHSFGSGTVHNTDEGRKYMDAVIENEMKHHIHLDLLEFFTAFFDSVNGLPHLVDVVFARCWLCDSYMDSKPPAQPLLESLTSDSQL
ncbi:hypothetical protein FPQ18DRAFT_409157 [Pyronema domesticum]|nr:hypothetical protein FPQ18DRAFT_409157 [Pyronema domesticum]